MIGMLVQFSFEIKIIKMSNSNSLFTFIMYLEELSSCWGIGNIAYQYDKQGMFHKK